MAQATLVCTALIILLGGGVTGQTSGEGGRIVGGEEAAEGEFPWQLSLQDSRGYHDCGAAVLNANFLVTAGHCSQYPAWHYRVAAGSNDRRYPLSVHSVVNITVHPDYGTTVYGASVNDIAIMRVEPPFTLGARIAAVRLPGDMCVGTPAGTLATVSGWGYTSSLGGDLPERLRKVALPIVSKEECNAIYEPFGGISEGSICAGFEEGGKDACQGDSGGPMVVGGELRGVVAWGFGCAEPGYPGVYTETAAFRCWIRDVTGL